MSNCLLPVLQSCKPLSYMWMGRLYLRALVVISLTNDCMPVHVHHSHCVECCNALIMLKMSVLSSIQLTFLLMVLACSLLSLLWYTLEWYIHTHAHWSTQFFLSLSSPCTQTIVGFADVCPDLLPAQALLMPVCWLGIFHSLSLSNEIRVADIGAIQ